MTEYGENIAAEEQGSDFQPAGPKPVKYRAAGFFIRLWAFLIDLFVINVLNAIIWNNLFPHVNPASFIHQLFNSNILFLGLIGAAYFILMTGHFQQTLGKMIVGIKVVQQSGQPLSWLTVIFREFVARSLSQLMGLNLGYLVCWFNAEKRCAHDFLSDTWVVYEKPLSDGNYVAVGNTAS